MFFLLNFYNANVAKKALEQNKFYQKLIFKTLTLLWFLVLGGFLYNVKYGVKLKCRLARRRALRSLYACVMQTGSRTADTRIFILPKCPI
jgi:hypothetical protein